MNYLSTYLPKLPHIPLGNFPTPIKKLTHLSEELDLCSSVYIKRDDISGSLYGGNKVRKLEYLLAEAIKRGACRVITSGAVGSNHALAVATYAAHLGLKPVLMLFGDQKDEHVRHNLLADLQTGADMYYDATFEEHLNSIKEKKAFYREKDGCEPYIIPAGGSSVIGVAGYINAAFELKEQIDKGDLPSPDTIFLPLGTMGTAAGLIIGTKLAQIKCKIQAIQVVPPIVADEQKYSALTKSANEYYHNLDNSFPLLDFSEDDFTINHNYFGQGYGLPTDQAQNAIRAFHDYEGIELDGVYSGKAAAAFLEYCKDPVNKDKTVLFWNTKSSVAIDIVCGDYTKLPKDFHGFFR